METTEKTKEALRRKELALDYKIYSVKTGSRRVNHPADEILDLYDKQYLTLALFAFDPQTEETIGCEIGNENSRDWFRIGYGRALMDALSIFSCNAIADRYAALIAEFEKENNIPEED